MEISGSYWKTCTLHAAVKLDIFSIIGEDSLTAKEMGNRIDGDTRAVSMLLDALAALALIEKEGTTYRNTPESLQYLVKNSPAYIGYMIMHHHHLAESWVNMDQTILSGKPNRERSSHTTEESRESFLMGMFNNAMAIAPGLSKTLDLSGCNHILDLGGGPGTYAIHFCLANPDLRASVYDLPTTRPFFEKTVHRFGLSHRVDFIEGDFVTDDLTGLGQFDAAWLSHVLHGETPATCREMIAKTVSLLNPGGKIFIHEFILEDSRAAPVFPALFSLNMLLGTDGGQSYAENELREMLTACGITRIERLDFTGPTESGILMGSL